MIALTQTALLLQRAAPGLVGRSAREATLERRKQTAVLARTGGNDTQVYPYEPLKWARRLREGPAADMAGKS